jgi:drug/metabolite transporter (DMT)-like permease
MTMPSGTPLISTVSITAAALLGAVGQFLFQRGSSQVRGVLGFFTNPYILVGMAGYIAVMGLFTYAFKAGGSVRVLYPIYSTTFIWAAVIACVWLGQPIRPVHVLGMILLVGGITCMSW